MPELAYADDACFRGDAPSKTTRPTARVENAAQAVRFAQCNVGKLYSLADREPCECGERGAPLTAPLIFCELLCRSLFHDFMLPRQPPFRPIISPILLKLICRMVSSLMRFTRESPAAARSGRRRRDCKMTCQTRSGAVRSQQEGSWLMCTSLRRLPSLPPAQDLPYCNGRARRKVTSIP